MGVLRAIADSDEIGIGVRKPPEYARNSRASSGSSYHAFDSSIIRRIATVFG